MTSKLRVAVGVVLAGSLVTGGWVLAQSNTFGTPESIIHISIIQWKDGISDAEKQKALDGVKTMAAEIQGIKNVWIKGIRVQPEGYESAFAIEFEDAAAAERYIDHPSHVAWTEHFLSVREGSISPQITN